jgi:hypothetical protein
MVMIANATAVRMPYHPISGNRFVVAAACSRACPAVHTLESADLASIAVANVACAAPEANIVTVCHWTPPLPEFATACAWILCAATAAYKTN